MAEREYQRLTRARARSGFSVAFTGRSSLWLGKDHVLCVESNGYTETYKRFYFRDIQAIIVQKNSKITVVNIVLAVIIVLLAGPAFVAHAQALKIFLLVLAGFFGLLLLINALQGATCRCFLRTAVQTEELPSLSRVRRLHKVLNRVRPFIVATQGDVLSVKSALPQTEPDISSHPAP